MSGWRDRKAAVQAEAAELVAAKEKAEIAEQHAVLAEKPEEEVLLELNLPNPDEMQGGDDFGAFMKSTVPADLRNRALRRLWTSNPALANVDLLVDYGEDFTGKNDPIGLIKTVYRVGKGMLPDKEEADDEVSEQVQDPVLVFDPEDEVEVYVQPEEEADIAILEPEVTPALAPRRRMRFDFGEGESPAPTGMEKQ